MWNWQQHVFSRVCTKVTFNESWFYFLNLNIKNKHFFYLCTNQIYIGFQIRVCILIATCLQIPQPINIALHSRIASPYTALGHVITEQDNKAHQINVLLRVLLTIHTWYMERSQDNQIVYFGITLYTVWFKLPICLFVVYMIRLRSDTNKYTSRTIYVKQYVYYWCHSHSNHQNQTYALSNQVSNVYMGL